MERRGEEFSHFPRLLLVGNAEEIHVGAHFQRAARSLQLDHEFSDMREAFLGSILLRRINWHLRGRRPNRLREFSQSVVDVCARLKPDCLISTGLAPVNAAALARIGKLGIKRLNYLTDDPWNPTHSAPWFLQAMPNYDHIFSTRRAILKDLKQIGCPDVTFLPFAYAPECHFPDRPATLEEQLSFDADIVFAGGGDRDREPLLSTLIDEGFTISLYGGYWERFPKTKPITRGHANPQTLRKAVSGAKVALCLVRRANRDGNVMRSFEVPVMGTCMLTEETEEHMEIFGVEGEAVVYFRTADEMVKKLRWLLAHPEERKRLATAAQRIVEQGCHTYKDRLITMLEVVRRGSALQ